ncbi:SGNH/GDSL hydrolase family protein [Streptomyces parvulus]|nr:SGNH/GDSL hydrolase family protein [Streptomyces parvulus]
MRRVRFVALGDSLTEGVGDPVGSGSGSRTGSGSGPVARMGRAAGRRAGRGARGVHQPRRQRGADLRRGRASAARGLALRPDVVSVVVGVNDTLRGTFDVGEVAARLDTVYSAFTGQGRCCSPPVCRTPGRCSGCGRAGRPLARRQRAVNAVVHALSERYGAVHLHACEGDWVTDRAMWSADRLHPGEGGHRQLALRFHTLLAERGTATGPAPSPDHGSPAPPDRRACGGWPPPVRAGWPGAASTCCPSS